MRKLTLPEIIVEGRARHSLQNRCVHEWGPWSQTTDRRGRPLKVRRCALCNKRASEFVL